VFDVHALRRQFPALNQQRADKVPIFLDGPGGTQVPQMVIDAMVHYLSTCNANHGGVFATSQESDAIVHRARQAMADLLNAPSPDEIIFGANMTTMTLHLSRALGRTWKPGDEVLVSKLDHDANIRPWVLAARDAGAVIRWIDFHPEDCTLDLESLRRQLSPRTKLVAVGAASNAIGTINDVSMITRWAKETGALVFVDAVHYAPHGPIDVQAWGCDFLACSAYKFFGPHVGVLWGRRELLETMPAYKLNPVPDSLPDRWMTGTQNHEGLAGASAAVEYLARTIGQRSVSDRRSRLRAAMSAIREYETILAHRLLEGLGQRPQFKVLGITDPQRLNQRVPTISITHPRRTAQELAEHLAAQQIYAWNGNMYAMELSERLGLEDRGGFLRLGLVHYNTAAEIETLLKVLDTV
jgi:cysteine desulfurase family protein (TIGR01976 family)